jgi:hypothetical protein
MIRRTVKMEAETSSETRYTYIGLHGVILQRTAIFMFYKKSYKGFQIVATHDMLDLQCPFSYISTPMKAKNIH